MKLYWTNKCRDNGYRCPNCQCLIGDKDGQMPKASKNHKIQMFDGKVKCVACNTTIGYFPYDSEIDGTKVRQGMTEKVLDSVEFISAIEQKEF